MDTETKLHFASEKNVKVLKGDLQTQNDQMLFTLILLDLKQELDGKKMDAQNEIFFLIWLLLTVLNLHNLRRWGSSMQTLNLSWSTAILYPGTTLTR